MTTLINVFGTTSSITQRFSDPIRLDPNKRYELGLKFLSFYNTIQNITTANNKFYYSVDSGTTYKTITLTPGSYEITTINDVISEYLIDQGDTDADGEPLIELRANTSTLKTEFVISDTAVRIDFTQTDTFRDLLGFDSIVVNTGAATGVFAGSNLVNIENDIRALFLTCDVVSGSYTSSSTNSGIINISNIIHSTQRSVPPGFRQIERIDSPIYLPVVRYENIFSITLRLVDQNGTPLPLGGGDDLLNYTLLIREMK